MINSNYGPFSTNQIAHSKQRTLNYNLYNIKLRNFNIEALYIYNFSFVLIVEATDADQPPQKTNTTITVEIIVS
jgi:hypothetical protein